MCSFVLDVHVGFWSVFLSHFDLGCPIDPFPCEKIMEKLLHHSRHFGRHYCTGAYG